MWLEHTRHAVCQFHTPIALPSGISLIPMCRAFVRSLLRQVRTGTVLPRFPGFVTAYRSKYSFVPASTIVSFVHIVTVENEDRM